MLLKIVFDKLQHVIAHGAVETAWICRQHNESIKRWCSLQLTDVFLGIVWKLNYNKYVYYDFIVLNNSVLAMLNLSQIKHISRGLLNTFWFKSKG